MDKTLFEYSVLWANATPTNTFYKTMFE